MGFNSEFKELILYSPSCPVLTSSSLHSISYDTTSLLYVRFVYSLLYLSLLAVFISSFLISVIPSANSLYFHLLTCPFFPQNFPYSIIIITYYYIILPFILFLLHTSIPFYTPPPRSLISLNIAISDYQYITIEWPVFWIGKKKKILHKDSY